MKCSLLLATLLGLTACAAPPIGAIGSGGPFDPSGMSPAFEGVQGVPWRVVRINGADALEGVTVHMSFSDGRVEGSAGTNRFFASYERGEGMALTIGSAGSTMMFNDEPPGRMDQEHQFLNVLESVDRYTVSGEGETRRLTLQDEAQVLIEAVPHEDQPS